MVTEQVEYGPASVHVKKRIRMKYDCPDSECRGTVLLADLQPQAVPKSKLAEGMLAFIATANPALHLPLYRSISIANIVLGVLDPVGATG